MIHEYEALIVRYLAGEALPDEVMRLEDWKQASSENQKIFDQYERLMMNGKEFKTPDLNQAWERIQPKEEEKTTVIFLKSWKLWAPAIAAVLIVGFFIYTNLNAPAVRQKPKPALVESGLDNVLFAKQGVEHFMLTDRSIVALSKGSSLELSADFAKGERRSKLKGSGRFTVVHDEKHPFVISVEGLEVYDLGTVFDIKTLDDTVKVIVYEGSVELRRNQKTIALEKGDSAFYLISEQLLKEYPTTEKRKDTVFEFDGTSLKEVVLVLEKFFGKVIEIKTDAIKECPLTVRFVNRSLPEILDVLEIMLDLEIVRKPSKIEIYGKGC